jgi:hypothetical protein
MKKFIYASIIATSILTLSSCQYELDNFNNNPNNPTQLSTPITLLTGAEIGTIMNSTGNLPRTFTLFTQHTNGNQYQSLDFTNYVLTEADNETDWSNIYQAGLNLNVIITQFGSANPYYDGIAKVLMALNIGYATDTWGDIPFSDAFQGASGNITPKYDTQEEIYTEMQSYLDAAITDFAQSSNANKVIPGTNDIFYQGDITKWTKLAYGLKARYAMRLSQRNGSTTAAQQVLQYVANALSSSSDNLVATFDGGNNQNLWYAFNNARAGYMSMGKYFINLLINNSDPRLSYFAAKNANGGYSGAAPEDNGDSAAVNSSSFGNYFAGTASTPNIIFSYSEVRFLEAEAQSRLGNTSDAQSALQAAISASLVDVTGSDNATFAATYSTDTSIKNIITQKYIALFTTYEPYNDWRRTGYPALTPNQNSQSKQIPIRLITPRSERTLNPNATVVGSMYTPVWWNN